MGYQSQVIMAFAELFERLGMIHERFELKNNNKERINFFFFFFFLFF